MKRVNLSQLLITLAVFLILVFIAWLVAAETFSTAMRWLIYVATATIIIMLLTILVVRIHAGLTKMVTNSAQATEQKWRTKTAEFEALKARRDAHLLVTKARHDEQVVVWESGLWHRLHLPDGQDTSAWREWMRTINAPKLIESPNGPALAAPESWPAHVDLLDLLPRGRGRLDNIILGVNVDGSGQRQVLSAPLWQLVHGAFGGETGTGKSTLAYAVAWQVATARQIAQLVLVDPGETTFKTLANSDRLLCPVVADESDCLAAIQMLWQEKNQRTELFKSHPTIEDLAAYNELVPADQALPYVVVLADELPELLENKGIQQALKKLIRVGRKYGIFLFGIGTSWKHTDLDTSIKRQFRTRIHFSASDTTSSRVLLDSPAAAELRDIGRAYARLPFSLAPDLVEIQAPYIDKEKAMALVPKGQQPEPLPLPAPVTDENDKLFVSLVKAGESRRQAAQQAYGKEYAGATVTRGKKALGEL